MADATIQWTDTEILAALIAAGAALVLALVNLVLGRRNLRDLEELKSDLSIEKSRSDARLSYEFEARKRLYHECEPILFQLTDAADRASGRILGFARTAAEGNLGPDRSWLDGGGHGYYWASSYYRLLLPTAITSLLRRRLTHLDLTLDARIYAQYELALAFGDTFTDDFDMARSTPALPYAPHGSTSAQRASEPEIYHQQGIPRGIAEAAAATLVYHAKDEAGLVDYARFEALVLSREDSDVRTAFGRISYLLDWFHPRRRPVLWRVLCAQWAICQALTELRDPSIPVGDLAERVRAKAARELFDWRSPDERASVPDARIDEPVEIGLGYVSRRLETIAARTSKAVAA